MTRITTNFRTTDTTSTDTSTQELLNETMQQLREALAAMNNIDDADLTEQYFHEKQRIIATIKAEMALITSGKISTGTTDSDKAELAKLNPLWNGALPDPENDYGRSIVESDPDYGEYCGTIIIPNETTKIAFQMTEEMERVDAESHGRDIILTVTYKDGTRQSWLIKDGTTAPNALVISANGLENGVTIDCSKVIRVNDGTYAPEDYENQKMYIVGSDGDDTLIGSQGDDLIVGNAGKDTIYGMGSGKDGNIIFGDEAPEDINTWTWKAGESDATNGEDSDTIYGGPGYNQIYGGDGTNTVYANSSDTVRDANKNSLDSATGKLPDTLADILSGPSDDWEISTESGKGKNKDEIILENTTDKGGQIDMKMPDGYNMATAKKEGNDLVITFIGFDEDGGMRSFKVRIKDFFSLASGSMDPSSVVRLNFKGSSGDDIIDFSGITVTSQVINISGGDGNDVLVGPHSQFLAEGIDPGQLSQSQGNSQTVLQGIVDTGAFVEDTERKTSSSAGYNATVDASGKHVDITGTGKGPITLYAPPGYDHGYITQGADGGLSIILVNAEGKTIVYHLDAAAAQALLNGQSINIANVSASGMSDITGKIIPISNVPENLDYTIDGGDGDDLVVAEKGSRTAGDDDVVDLPEEQETKQQSTETDMTDDEWKAEVEKDKTSADFKAADTSEDGTISSDEWATYMKSHTRPKKKSS